MKIITWPTKSSATNNGKCYISWDDIILEWEFLNWFTSFQSKTVCTRDERTFIHNSNWNDSENYWPIFFFSIISCTFIVHYSDHMMMWSYALPTPIVIVKWCNECRFRSSFTNFILSSNGNRILISFKSHSEFTCIFLSFLRTKTKKKRENRFFFFFTSSK